jgi:hypothetical protein
MSGEHLSPIASLKYLYLPNDVIMVQRSVVPMEMTFMDTEDGYKIYGTLRSLRYIYSNPFRFLISSLGLPKFPSQKS